MDKAMPVFSKSSFRCPHCNAIAHQDWYKMYAIECTNENPPSIWTATSKADVEKSFPIEKERSPFITSMLENIDLEILGHVTLQITKDSIHRPYNVGNIHLSKCYSCNKFSIWRKDNLIFPETTNDYIPSDDMPDDIKSDFIEAAKIVNISPRGSCALLRLVVQKLCVYLGGTGGDINKDIAQLVRNGLNKTVQQALDTVRVIGNQAVHPGELDLKDDVETASVLFGLINYIVENQITQPKKVDAIYKLLPASKIKAIEERDAEKSKP